MTQEFETLEAVLRARHSCRGFQDKAVPKADIARIVRAAGRAPSWCNSQPWQVSVASGAATDRFRAALRQEVETGQPAPDLPFPAGYSGVYRDRRRVCGFQLYDAVGVERGDRVASAQQMMRNFDLFDAPHVAVLHSPTELGPYGAMDCGGFITAFMLAAQTLGVASIAQAAVASYAPFVRQHFGIGADRMVLCVLSFGYADTDHPANGFRTERADPADVIDWVDG